jgi:hypothetical protein
MGGLEMRRGWIATASVVFILFLMGSALAATKPVTLSVVYSANINGHVLACPT